MTDMYLKSMELQGFKSFANKMRLDFHDGITGIVGPNGSGKSNVADAVRWVLGEQSARQLRGGNMQDVIFSGTENRKALGFASVAITLDNADRQLNYDAEEITVTRRLYRSGESEYLLNGRNCRLRDINELFYDTGIGKEGYSIIGQGQIDQILSGKPEDRRALFDEAAGIVKFKRRKTATIRKLESEEANLVRVNDILSELTRQLGPLRSQAEKAEIYLKKRDSLRLLDIRLYQTESRKAEEQSGQIRTNMEIAQEQIRSIDEAFEKTRQEYDRVEQQLEAIDERVGHMREQSQAEALLAQQAEGQIRVLEEQLRTARRNSEMFLERQHALQEEKKQRQETLVREEQDRKALAEALSEAEAAKKTAEKAASDVQEEISSRAREETQGRNDTIDLLNGRTAIRERRQRYDTMLEQIGIRQAEVTSRMLEMKRESAAGEEILKNLEDELASVTEQAEALKKKTEKTEKETAGLRKVIDEQSRQLEIGQSAYHREASRLESLRNIAERYEGYGNSIRRVMEQKDSNPGIHGVVADLIRTEKKYETAIETALGGSLQNIVTDNENTAKYLIEYLKRGHYGRATFLPLTAMKEEQPFDRPAVLREEGVLGKADDLVSCQNVYKGVVNRLLGRTVVVDTIDHAIRIGRKYRQSVRMVTLEGELLSPGGSMTGGSFRYKSNLLGRKREIDELDASVRALKKEMEAMQASVEENRTRRNALRDSLTEMGDELQKLYLRQNTAALNRDAALQRAEESRAEYAKLQRERQETEQQIAEITEKRAVIDLELEESREQEERIGERLQALSQSIRELQEKEQETLREQDRARQEWTRLQEQSGFMEERLQMTRTELNRLDEEMTGLLQNIREEQEGTGEKQAEIDRLQEEITQRRGTVEACEAAMDGFTRQKEELNRSHRTFFEQRDELSEQKTQMSQEYMRLENALEKLESAREARISYLYEEYELTPDQAEKYVFDEPAEPGSLKKEIRGLREEIRSLGNVNVSAIEEYRELKERHGFLSGQQQDLVQATETLQGIIGELDEGMRKQFREKFALIREEFDKAFRQLFGGGKGTLELVEGEDLLECGIVIISQPPGKKLQNMMQLSGGEKALTAIALLFAIQNLKPSPFCLLDEIEAALDDNNVVRFAKYLHRLTKNTQFIIITHRRGTMNAADRLYGITMQEKGVSALVSVDLVEAQLDK